MQRRRWGQEQMVMMLGEAIIFIMKHGIGLDIILQMRVAHIMLTGWGRKMHSILFNPGN
jgi:hypothetical protein